MPIPYPTFCAEVSQTGHIQRNKSGCRANIGNIMQEKRNRKYRSTMHARPHPYAGTDSPEIFGIRNSRIFKREIESDDL